MKNSTINQARIIADLNAGRITLKQAAKLAKRATMSRGTRGSRGRNIATRGRS